MEHGGDGELLSLGCRGSGLLVSGGLPGAVRSWVGEIKAVLFLKCPDVGYCAQPWVELILINGVAMVMIGYDHLS